MGLSHFLRQRGVKATRVVPLISRQERLVNRIAAFQNECDVSEGMP
jgi:hypothetical protein